MLLHGELGCYLFLFIPSGVTVKEEHIVLFISVVQQCTVVNTRVYTCWVPLSVADQLSVFSTGAMSCHQKRCGSSKCTSLLPRLSELSVSKLNPLWNGIQFPYDTIALWPPVFTTQWVLKEEEETFFAGSGVLWRKLYGLCIVHFNSLSPHFFVYCAKLQYTHTHTHIM